MKIMSTIRPELFQEFAFFGSLLVLKMLAMSMLTGFQRFRKKAFVNPEDLQSKAAKINTNDPDVERVRRAHRNDLENALPWFIMTLLWLSTGPSTFLAKVLIRTFVGARFAHTLAYAVFAVQPHRAIAFFVGYAITLYQAVVTMMHYM